VKKLLSCAMLALLTVACDPNSSPNDPSQVNIEFTVTDLVVGTGAEAVTGASVTVNYFGWLYNPANPDSKGFEFDSSFRPGRGPLPISPLGTAQIIPGVQQAVLGMKVGGRRRAYIPASLAYGSRGNGDIPPNAATVFELELLTVQ
jgi:FKBP-type peptidyl-prolyl cis-trans isomerase FkpA